MQNSKEVSIRTQCKLSTGSWEWAEDSSLQIVKDHKIYVGTFGGLVLYISSFSPRTYWNLARLLFTLHEYDDQCLHIW